MQELKRCWHLLFKGAGLSRTSAERTRTEVVWSRFGLPDPKISPNQSERNRVGCQSETAISASWQVELEANSQKT